MLRWPTRGPTLPVVHAIADDVEGILGRIGTELPDLRVSITGANQACQLVGDLIVLDATLLGPDLYAGRDAQRPPGLALDRFRRATGLVVEGALVHAAAVALDQPVEAMRDAWWAVGPAAEAVDRAAPDLGWLWPSLADLLSAPGASMAAAPRRAGWWFRYLDHVGARPADPTVVDAVRWAAFGQWLRQRGAGPGASCPVALERAAPSSPDALPPTAASLSHQPLALPGGEVGTRWTTQYGELAGTVAAAAGTTSEAILGNVSAAPIELTAHAPGPVGQWSLSSGHFGTRVGAARGVELRLEPGGAAELTGADAFVGPPTRELLTLAEQFGVSGSATGSWCLARIGADGQRGQLSVRGLDGDAAVHSRSGGGFALPAGDWLQPVRAVLAMLNDRPIDWRMADERNLELRVDLSGTEMAFAFERVD